MADIASLVRLARPHQYVKNFFVLVPLFFGSKLGDPAALQACLGAFAAFSLLASSVYVFNDLNDVASDRQHPVKKNRPIASGRISPGEGVAFALGLAAASFLVCLHLEPATRLVLLAYLVMNLAYSLWLKHIAILDVVCVSLGFILRVSAGTLEAHLEPSHWLMIMTFLLAMFLALAKRHDDLRLSGNGQQLRKCLDGYNLEFVSLGMILAAGIVIVIYLLFTLSPEVTARYHTSYLYLTGFWVILGILRYLQITFVEEKGGSPTRAVLKDIFLQTVIVCWVANYYIIIYMNR